MKKHDLSILTYYHEGHFFVHWLEGDFVVESMTKEGSFSNFWSLLEIVRPECSYCRAPEEFWKQFSQGRPYDGNVKVPKPIQERFDHPDIREGEYPE